MRRVVAVLIWWLSVADVCASGSERAAALDWLKKIGANCSFDDADRSRLTKVGFASSPITDDDLSKLKALPEIKELVFWKNDLSDEGLVHLADMENIESLTVHLASVTDDGLKHLRGLKKLRFLHLDGVNVTGEGFTHLAHLPELRQVRWYSKTENLKHLQHLKALEEFRFFWRESDLAHLRNVPQIRRLEIWGLPPQEKLPDRWLESLEHLKRLESIRFEWVRLTPTAVDFLAAMPKLRELSLSAVALEAGALERFSKMTRLEKLELKEAGRWLTDKALAQFSGCLKLRYLDLSNNTRSKTDGLTAAGLQHIAGLENLVHLDLSGNWLPGRKGEVLQPLRALSNLTYVSLSMTSVTGGELKYLPPKLERLYLEWTHVDDDGLAHLSRLSNLRILSLAYATKVTDEGLSHFRGLTKLERLALPKMGITDAAVQQLQKALPKVSLTRY